MESLINNLARPLCGYTKRSTDPPTCIKNLWIGYGYYRSPTLKCSENRLLRSWKYASLITYASQTLADRLITSDRNYLKDIRYTEFYLTIGLTLTSVLRTRLGFRRRRPRKVLINNATDASPGRSSLQRTCLPVIDAPRQPIDVFVDAFKSSKLYCTK